MISMPLLNHVHPTKSQWSHSYIQVQPPSGVLLFYISPEDGQITISRPLATDEATSRYTITVKAEDLGDKPLSSTAQVTVEVMRNKYSPQFPIANDARNIDFTRAVGEEVYMFNAQDLDVSVSADVLSQYGQWIVCK